jgi:hypothetical protein
MATWKDADSLNASKIFAVAITKLQSDVLRSLAAHGSPDSYIAGGVAINREGHPIPLTSIFCTISRPDLSAARTDTSVFIAEGHKRLLDKDCQDKSAFAVHLARARRKESYGSKRYAGNCWRTIFSTLRSPSLQLRPHVNWDSSVTAVPTSSGMQFLHVDFP